MTAVFRKNAPQTNHSLSVNGGNEQVKYYFSGQYLNQESNLRNSDEGFKEYNLRSNIDVNVSANLKVNMDIAARKENRQYPAIGIRTIMHEAVSMYPFIPDYYANGLPSAGISNGRNPMIMSSSAAGYDKVINLIVNPKIGFDLKLPYITEGLSVNGYAAFDYNVIVKRNLQNHGMLIRYDKTTGAYNNVKNSTGITSVTQNEQIRQSKYVIS